MLYALIPVKDLDAAKTRLADVLEGASRRDLVVAMYRDVLAAAIACPAIDGVAVVSRDEEVLSMAEKAGAEAMHEPGGLNEALTSAASTLAGRGIERLLVLAADLPLDEPVRARKLLWLHAEIVKRHLHRRRPHLGRGERAQGLMHRVPIGVADPHHNRQIGRVPVGPGVAIVVGGAGLGR